MKSILRKEEGKKCILLFFAIVTILTSSSGQGQQKYYIKGELKEKQSMQAVPFATVALRRTSDSTLITGTASDINGQFILESVASGNYCIVISAIGYNPETKNIFLTNDCNTGTILLKEESLTLGEIVVTGERIKAKAEADKTTYFLNEKMYSASNNGVDMLKYIPGVQVDLMKNISLEGSRQIIILVDGKECDRNFLSQLDPAKIDKVEIINTPGSRYDADITGVINIILKKEKESGMNGHIHAEVPTSESLIYISPDYSINYSFNKLNLYTSYNGDISYLDIIESSDRTSQDAIGTTEIKSEQVLRQNDWSHRFHYGFDYIFNEKNQINFYAFYNPWSNELNGNVRMMATGDKTVDQNWSALKQDEDINRSAFYSLYYKHIFNKPGKEISFDLSYYNFKAVNSTTYITTDSSQDNSLTNQVNTVKPKQNSLSLKVDYSSPIGEKLRFEAGIKAKSQLLQDRQSSGFKYDENVFALYGTIIYNFSKFTLSTGLRAEKSASGLTDSFSNNVLAFLPNATINLKLNPKQNIKLSYSRTVYRPNIYELNPYTSIDDPFTLQSGNPDLKPEFRQNLSISYSQAIGNNYFSSELFYNGRTNVINHYTFVNDVSVFETRVANMGNIQGYGIQMSGALKLNKAIAINPYLRLTETYTRGNNLAAQYNIADKHKIAFESGLSAIVTFKYDITASLQFHYNSPVIDIQSKSFSDALYFISLEKTFKQRFKAGITSALPFSRSFTYQGTEIKGENFYSHSQGNVKLSAFPVWLKFTYLFNSGKATNNINRTKDETDIMPKKGF
jgi:Outer membrane protein beta-barrel family/CarboxypepD_reg-like domain